MINKILEIIKKKKYEPPKGRYAIIRFKEDIVSDYPVDFSFAKKIQIFDSGNLIYEMDYSEFNVRYVKKFWKIPVVDATKYEYQLSPMWKFRDSSHIITYTIGIDRYE